VLKNQTQSFKGQVELRNVTKIFNMAKFINKVLKLRLLKRLYNKNKIYLKNLILIQATWKCYLGKRMMLLRKINSCCLKKFFRNFVSRRKIFKITLIQKFTRRL